jgi:MFS family permease
LALSASEAEGGLSSKRSVLSRLASEFSFIRGNFLVLVVSWIFMDFARELPGTYYPLYVQALGGSAATIGLIGFASTAAQALVMFPGGYLADKYGRRWLVSTMTFTLAFSWLFYALASSWLTIMAGAVVAGLCMIYIPAFHALVMDSLPAERRGMGFSIINLIEGVSTTPAPLIAGIFYSSMGLAPSLRLGYHVTFVAFLAAGIIRFRIRETLVDPPKVGAAEIVRSIPASIKDSFRVWSRVPRSAFTLFLVNTLMTFSYSMMQPVLLLYITGDLGISPADWALVGTTLFISMLLLALPTGKLIDRIGKKIPLMLSFAASTAGIALLFNGDLLRLYIAVPLYGWVIILLNSSVSSLFADLVPKGLRGKVSGFTGFFNLLAVSIGMLMGGLLYDNVSHQLPLLLQFVLPIPPFLLMALFIKEPEKKEI